MSKKLTNAKQNYIITEKKMLAIIQAAKEWRKYLKEAKTKVEIIINHKNLTYFQEVEITNKRQVK